MPPTPKAARVRYSVSDTEVSVAVVLLLTQVAVAAMQALRLASFTSRPTLRGIQTMTMLAPYLTNSGRFLDAWSLSGMTIRLAHSIGLHRDPRFLDPAPSLRECTVRKNLWWWLLHMDQEYSMTLGRPLGISGIGDCPPPDPLTTDPVALRLSEFFDQLTILGRQILSSNQLTDSKIDMYTDRLIALWDTMPDSLQFNKSWIKEETEIPEWPMETRATSKTKQPSTLYVTDNLPHSILLQHTQLHHPSEPSAHRKQSEQS